MKVFTITVRSGRQKRSPEGEPLAYRPRRELLGAGPANPEAMPGSQDLTVSYAETSNLKALPESGARHPCGGAQKRGLPTQKRCPEARPVLSIPPIPSVPPLSRLSPLTLSVPHLSPTYPVYPVHPRLCCDYAHFSQDSFVMGSLFLKVRDRSPNQTNKARKYSMAFVGRALTLCLWSRR